LIICQNPITPPTSSATILSTSRACSVSLLNSPPASRRHLCHLGDSPACFMTVATQAASSHHLANVHSQSPLHFSCDVCNCSFTAQTQLTQHTRQHSAPVPRFSCVVRGERYTGQAYLNMHTHQSHTSFPALHPRYLRPRFHQSSPPKRARPAVVHQLPSVLRLRSA
jgi:hypothetical protein